MNSNTAAVFTSYPSAYNLKCPREVIDCLVRNNGSVLKVIRTPFYQKNRRVDIVVSRQNDTLSYSGHPAMVRAAMRVTFNELRKHSITFLQLKELAHSLDVQVNGMRRTQSPVQQQLPVSKDDFEVLKRSTSQENVGGHQEFTRQRSATFSHIQRSKRIEAQHQQTLQQQQQQQQQQPSQPVVHHYHQQQQMQHQQQHQQKVQQIQHQQMLLQQQQQRIQQQQQQQQLLQQQQHQQLMKQATPRPARRSEPIMNHGSVDINPRQLQTMITSKTTANLTSTTTNRPAVPQPQHRQTQPPKQERHITLDPVQQQRQVPAMQTSDDNISVRSVQTQERPVSTSRVRAVSIENLHKSPGRTKISSQLTREDSLRSQQSVGPRRSRRDIEHQNQNGHAEADTLTARLEKLEKQRDDLEYQNSKAHDALEELENKRDKLEKMLREERENSKNKMMQMETKKDELQNANYQMQQVIKNMREKMETLEKEKEDLQVNCAVIKAEKHNAISALDTFKQKQQNVTEEIAHLYRLNSEQAVKITEFEKEKKLNTEEFAYLYKIKNDQAEKLKELEKQEKDLSQFHKTISDQAVKISELEKTNTVNMEKLTIFSEKDAMIKELKNNEIEKNKELKTLDNTILEQATNVSNLEREIKGKDDEILRLNQQKMDQNVKINELQKEVEKLRKLVSDQSTKINEAEHLKKEIIQVQPKKEIFHDLSRLKDHYQETINNLKTKYEDTKILLSLRDQELAILRRRSHKQSMMELDSESRKDSVESFDTVDENDGE